MLHIATTSFSEWMQTAALHVRKQVVNTYFWGDKDKSDAGASPGESL